MINFEGEYLTTAISICNYLAILSGTKPLLFGANYDSEAKVIIYIYITKF